MMRKGHQHGSQHVAPNVLRRNSTQSTSAQQIHLDHQPGCQTWTDLMVEIDARNDAQKTMLVTSQEVMCDSWRRGQLTPASVQLWTAGATAPLIKRQHSTKPCGYKLRPIGLCEVLPTMVEGTYHQAEAASTIQARPWTHIETR